MPLIMDTLIFMAAASSSSSSSSSTRETINFQKARNRKTNPITRGDSEGQHRTLSSVWRQKHGGDGLVYPTNTKLHICSEKRRLTSRKNRSRFWWGLNLKLWARKTTVLPLDHQVYTFTLKEHGKCIPIFWNETPQDTGSDAQQTIRNRNKGLRCTTSGNCQATRNGGKGTDTHPENTFRHLRNPYGDFI
jgi:hypothetical protein